MFKVLIDTCVWLDLAKDYQQQAILAALEELVRHGKVELILPRTVVDEFARNKMRVVEESSRSLSGTLKRAKEAVEKFGDPRRRTMVLGQLNDVDHRLPMLGDAAATSVARVEALFMLAPIIEISDAVKLRAAQRGIEKRAPFHRQRNGIDDAILIEVYADEISTCRTTGRRFAFVTHNTKDFSHPATNNKLPHPDLSAYFSRVKSLYFTSLGEALRRVDPAEFSDLMIEQEWIGEPRRLTEIIRAVDELCAKIWYNRHQITLEKIADGTNTIVEKITFPMQDQPRGAIQRDVWEGARKAAAKVEKKYGLENLGPWDDFEWGMLSGKLSALRWVLGEDWDMLDT